MILLWYRMFSCDTKYVFHVFSLLYILNYLWLLEKSRDIVMYVCIYIYISFTCFHRRKRRIHKYKGIFIYEYYIITLTSSAKSTLACVPLFWQ